MLTRSELVRYIDLIMAGKGDDRDLDRVAHCTTTPESWKFVRSVSEMFLFELTKGHKVKAWFALLRPGLYNRLDDPNPSVVSLRKNLWTGDRLKELGTQAPERIAKHRPPGLLRTTFAKQLAWLKPVSEVVVVAEDAVLRTASLLDRELLCMSSVKGLRS